MLPKVSGQINSDDIWNVIGLVLRSTKNIANVDVTHRERQEGSSGYSIQKLLSLWMNGFTAFSVKPLRLASLLGLILAAVGFISTIILVLNKLAHPSEVMPAQTDWPT